MKKPLQYIGLAAAVALTASIAEREASAQIRLGVGVPEVEVNVGARAETRTSSPYVHDGYQSGQWHTRREFQRRNYWDARYEGYDCYEAFQYTYERGDRVRYDTTFCHDHHGRPYEVRETRTTAGVR